MLMRTIMGPNGLPAMTPVPGVTEFQIEPGSALDKALDNPDVTINNVIDAVAVDELIEFAKKHPMVK